MSKHVYFNRNKQIDRRLLLKGAGVAMAMPWLTAMEAASGSTKNPAPPRRFVAMTLGLGLLPENLNPTTAGPGYESSRYLEPLNDLRDQFTVISGCSHPGVTGGHRAEASILTANPVGSSGRAKNTISLDQYMAKYQGHETRFSSLVVSSSGSSSPSYTENGAMVPALDSPRDCFRGCSSMNLPRNRRRLPACNRDAASWTWSRRMPVDCNAELGAGDRDRLDAYFTSVRELELRMAESEAWARRPKPKVNVSKPVDIGNPNDFIGRQRLMSDVLRLAIETDSTRFITYHLGGSGAWCR
ncbi:MAG: DUF1552 domain-containing protein [Planctomycetaceae bacterium]